MFSVRGGIPRFNQMLCLALDRLTPVLGLDVTVISASDTLQHYREHGEPWEHVKLIPGNGLLRLSARTLSFCLRERPDLMLLGLLGMTPLGWASRPFLQRGFGFIGHGTECWNERRASRRITARRSSFAFAVSGHTKQALARTIGLSPDTIRLLPNTLDPGFVSLDLPELERPGPELLTVSRLWAEEKMKGVDHTLHAFAAIAERFPEARYHIVGKGSDKPRLIELRDSLGLGERVVFHEGLTDEELAERYRGCGLFVMPSGQEGFGIVFLEAMRFSKPCIGGNAGGTPEVIDHERTGLLVPYGSVDTLAAALVRLLSDAQLRRTMGRAGRQRLFDEFIFDRFQERLEGHLRALLD